MSLAQLSIELITKLVMISICVSARFESFIILFQISFLMRCNTKTWEYLKVLLLILFSLLTSFLLVKRVAVKGCH